MSLAEALLSLIAGEANTKETARKMYEIYTGQKCDEQMLEEVMRELEDGENGDKQ